MPSTLRAGTAQRPVSVRPAVVLSTALTAAGAWLLATLINQWIAATGAGPVITGLKPLIPATGPAGLADVPAPWLFLVPLAAALALGSLLFALLPAVLLNRHSTEPTTEAATEPPRKRFPAGRGARAVLGVLPALGFAVVLVAAISLAAAAPRGTTPAVSEPAPTPQHYGHPDVSAAVDERAPGSAHPDGGHWCSGDAVHTAFGIGDAATGHRSQLLRFTNTSERTCRLGDYPDIVFGNADGDAMDVLFYRGGSFMTDDAGPAAVILEPGSSATAALGWNAMATAGVPTPGAALVAPYAGAARADPSPVLDITDGVAVAITAWARESEAGS